MRIQYGHPQPSRTFDPAAAGWTPLSGQDSRRFVFIALLLSLPGIVAASVMTFQWAPAWKVLLSAHAWGFPAFVLALLLLVPVHEFIHALAYRCGLRSPDLVLGLWPQRGLVYVLYDAPLPRRRVLAMLAAPFLLLTVLPLSLLGLVPAEARSLAAFFIVIHASACSGDVLTLVRLWTQAPPDSLIHNQRDVTFWGGNAI